MRKTWIIIALLFYGANAALASGGYVATGPPVGPDGAQALFADAILQSDKNADVVLVGTVTKIFPVAGLRKRWAVVVRVERVVSGDFPDATFTFKVHSPSRAGLRVRRVYLIKASRVGEGYVVDESALEEVCARATSAPRR
jgi:hypothetical protein